MYEKWPDYISRNRGLTKSDQRHENWFSKRNRLPEIASSNMSNLPKSRDELLPTNTTARQSHISANFVKLDSTPININLTCAGSEMPFVSTSTRDYENIVLSISSFASRENLYTGVNIRLCAVTCAHILALSATSQCIAYISTGENKDKICASEAGISSERAGLAGWYCRAGCGRSSHFGDEISLSNPAPCFIRSGHPRCVPRWQTFLCFV